MPDRIIRDELLQSEKWLSLKDNADRLAFVALLLSADSLGNFSAEPFRLLRLWRDFGINTAELVAKTTRELVDHDLRRFQYAITNNPLITSHLGTYDVIELTPTTCIVVYSTNVEPEVFALAIGAAAGEGMRFLEKKYGIPKNEGTR